MKKLIPIILILVLAVIVMCFVACGNDTMDNTLTSMSNEMTSIMDDATTLGEALEEDMTDLSDAMTTTDNLTDTTDLTDMSDTTVSGAVTAE